MTQANHLALSAERYTPEWLVEPSRIVLDGISLDPASCAAANSVVKADRYYSLERGENGLSLPWSGTTLVNSPSTCVVGVEGRRKFPGCGTDLASGKKRRACGCRLVERFWGRLVEHFEADEVPAAIWVGFNKAQLQSLQKFARHPLSFPTCVLKARVSYLGPDLLPLTAPPHTSYVTYLGHHPDRFSDIFRELGTVVMEY